MYTEMDVMLILNPLKHCTCRGGALSRITSERRFGHVGAVKTEVTSPDSRLSLHKVVHETGTLACAGCGGRRAEETTKFEIAHLFVHVYMWPARGAAPVRAGPRPPSRLYVESGPQMAENPEGVEILAPLRRPDRRG